MANAYVRFFQDEKNREVVEDLLREIEFEEQASAGLASGTAPVLDGLNFVITGSVEHFKNRNELKETIESLGGKTTDSVTSKTDYLINNDSTSNSTKNKKARELGVKIITEEQFLDWINSNAKPEN
jgi:DNA ligase (NAD+)